MHINRMRSLRALGLVGLALVLANPAQAANVHLKGGKNAEPSFNDGGVFLSATGAIVGLGFGDVIVNMVASGNGTASCANPGQGGGEPHEPPGKNPVPVTLTGTQAIPDPEIKNGHAVFNVSTSEAGEVSGAPDCTKGEGNWTETITNVAFTSATITVDQGGDTVLTVDCTFAAPGTSNGAVPKNQVTCTQS